MKTTTKILLLVIFCFVAVAAVMIFAKTKVTPYTNPAYEAPAEQYITAIKADIRKLSDDKPLATNDSLYFAISHKLLFQTHEKLISSDDYNTYIAQLLDAYVPIFVGKNKEVLSSNNWDSNDLSRITARVAEIRGIHVSFSAKGQLEDIDNIKAKYDEAWRAAYVGGYQSIKDSEQKIATARRYAGNDYLSHCRALVASLKRVPGHLNSAHYRYLSSLVNKLQDYQYHSWDWVCSTYDTATKEINNYNNKANDTYGTKKDTDYLKRLAEQYKQEAYYYFTNGCARHGT